MSFNILTSPIYNNSYNISITSYSNNELYKIQTYETPIQASLTEQQILKRNATRYRNENSIELTTAYEVDGRKFMHCLCLGKELELYNVLLDEKVLPFFIREQESDRLRAEKQAKSIAISTARSKKKIYEYAMSNDWQYFVTFTFNDDKMVTDATNYDECSKRLSYYLNNLRKIFPHMTYLIVPEQHTKNRYYNGSIVYPTDPNYELGCYRWHFHGLFNGIEETYMKPAFNSKTKQPIIENGKQVYTLANYHSENYGFSTISRIENQKAVSNYICKYITKETVELSKGKRRYWVSKNLNLKTPKKKCDTTLKDAVEEYFRESGDYFKEQTIDTNGYHQKISYILTDKRETVDKIQHFDIQEYHLLCEMKKNTYFQEIHSLYLGKGYPNCMQEYLSGRPVKVIQGPFYNDINWLDNETLTAPIHSNLSLTEVDGQLYTYISYDTNSLT